jgi:hypothetical protein
MIRAGWYYFWDFMYLHADEALALYVDDIIRV